VILIETDSTLVAIAQRTDFSLGAVFGDSRGFVNNAQLSTSTRYASIVDQISADIALVQKKDPQAGVGVHRFSHRLFDVRWLRSDRASFNLVGVVNRLDRAPFHAGSCGETRLVYRLAYDTYEKRTAIRSRLPMTIGVEVPLRMPPEGCRELARRWIRRPARKGEVPFIWLTGPDGPLEPTKSAFSEARIVVNVQQLRWPAAVRPDLAGHAEYLLRSFRLSTSGKTYVAEPLENTPDLARFASDATLKKNFLAWLGEPANLAAVDRGTPVIPEQFLAKQAISVTPRGLARRANRPFSSIFSGTDFAAFDFSKLLRVRSPEGLLRRLDELTCQGCHESRSIAGFHLLGDDPEDTPSANALSTGMSPHLAGDLARRDALVRSLLAGHPKPDFSQPYPERGEYSGYGAHCGLGTDPTFASWKCDAGLACQPYDAPAGDVVGQCLPSEPRAAGDPCEAGPLDAKRDRVAKVTRKDCASSAVCNTNAVGFPGGMCTETCDALSPQGVCGGIAILDPFNACVARGEPFMDCLANNVRPAGFRACDAESPCRDDYICTKPAAGKTRGTCIPPYFLFQLRVDGHP
jgi:hypothetical protein